VHRNGKSVVDWDPFVVTESGDQRDVYDRMRAHCPVAYSDRLEWSVFRHDDVMRVLTDHEAFSNDVSRHLSVPNGMDPPQHTAYRQVIEPYFSDDRLRAFEPVCRRVIVESLQRALTGNRIELISDFALDVSVHIHCAFLGWPDSLHTTLADWTLRNHEATRADDRAALARFAQEFEDLVTDLLEQRRQTHAGPDTDTTAALMHETVHGRLLDDGEITSILRNWTVGEIGTTSAAIGILVHFLTEHPELQQRLRIEPSLLPAAIDEMLRLHGPLVTNRRVATRTVELGGRTIEAGDRVTLNWVSVNRDEDAFDNATTFQLDRDQSNNLLYGAGIHICPGAQLARLELRLIIEELLARTACIERDPASAPIPATYPASGYSALPVVIR